MTSVPCVAVTDEAYDKARLIQERSSHTLLLILGVIFGGLAFGLPTVLQIHKEVYDPLETNYVNELFPSGRNYSPLNVSELVHDGYAPTGKAFLAFSLISVCFFLMCWYPWKLVNVYVGQAAYGPRALAMKLASIQHLGPPIGMLMVNLIPVKSRNIDFGHRICNNFHTVGAVGMIGGYCICELHCLFCHKWKRARIPTNIRLKPGEWGVRMTLLVLSIVSAVGYIGFDAIHVEIEKSGTWDCTDVYKVPTESDRILMAGNLTLFAKQVRVADAVLYNKKLLYNTATGMCLFVKRGSFWCECFAGVFMLLSNAAIWFYSPERKACDAIDQHVHQE